MRRPVLATVALSLLALLFGWETRQALQAVPGGRDNVATAPAGAWQPGVTTPDPQPPPDPGPTVAAVTARPLFRPDRQPFREQAGSPVPARNYEAEMSRFSLLGVLGLGDAPMGLVTSKSGHQTDRWELKAGDALPGFMVKEVRTDGLLLAADGREFLLPLYAGAPTAAPGGALRTDVQRQGRGVRGARRRPPPRRRPVAGRPSVPGASRPAARSRDAAGLHAAYVPGRR